MNILEFKNMFKAAKRTASNFDEFCDELELYLEAEKKQAAKLSKKEMVEKLVNDSIDTVYSGEDDSIAFLDSIFRNGFIGFESMSEEELIGELDGRGLLHNREEYIDGEENEDEDEE